MSLISGIKEKVIAAKRVGIGKVMLQIDNERDYNGMQGYLKKNPGCPPCFRLSGCSKIFDLLSVKLTG
jgi:ATP-dependent Lon protease